MNRELVNLLYNSMLLMHKAQITEFLDVPWSFLASWLIFISEAFQFLSQSQSSYSTLSDNLPAIDEDDIAEILHVISVIKPVCYLFLCCW